jgi:adenosine deaminase
MIDERYYERITYEILTNCAACNVKHVEAIFSPYDHIRRGLEYGKMLDNISRGIKKAADDFKVTCNIRVDLVRNYGPEIGMKVLDLVEEKRDNIVAIDTGGSEFGYPPGQYEFCYERARKMGLHTVAHQGEAAGIDYVWECLKTLRPERIGHGVAASEDVELMREIYCRGISIETCPISNVRTGAVPNLRAHPIKDFIANGIKVSVSTDDPPMFGTSMNYEYLQLHEKLGFSVEDLFKISLDSITTSFLPKENKIMLNKEFIKEYNSLASEFE